LDQFVVDICGQEIGTKKEVLAVTRQFAPQRALMVGDAPGDYAAAIANQCLFFPILPGAEESSWLELQTEGVERFLSGQFAGQYQQRLLEAFELSLPETPMWKQSA
jgi:phosphoglycolate phosphatase-like HAD superfamily hydrolase